MGWRLLLFHPAFLGNIVPFFPFQVGLLSDFPLFLEIRDFFPLFSVENEVFRGI